MPGIDGKNRLRIADSFLADIRLRLFESNRFNRKILILVGPALALNKLLRNKQKQLLISKPR
ncbi:hypothetical protein D3C87_2151710 [compost metagenome]